MSKSLQLIKEHDVKWVDLRFTDTKGKQQHVTMPARDALDDAFSGLPEPGLDLAAIADPDARRAALQDAVLAGWEASDRSGQEGQLAPAAEHPRDFDPTAVFLARVLIPATADLPPQRDGTAVLVDNWSRRFIPSLGLLGRWVGI